MNPPLADCILDRSNLAQLPACPVHRMGDGQGYEFIYLAPCETKLAKRALVPAEAGIRLAEVSSARTKPLSSPRTRGPITTKFRLSLALPHRLAAAYGSPPSRGRQRLHIFRKRGPSSLAECSPELSDSRACPREGGDSRE